VDEDEDEGGGENPQEGRREEEVPEPRTKPKHSVWPGETQARPNSQLGRRGGQGEREQFLKNKRGAESKRMRSGDRLPDFHEPAT
jgi:hypothetical protein